MRSPSIIFWVIAIGLGIACELLRRRRLVPLLGRSCAGREWRRSFPGVPKDQIREFLKVFVDDFALPAKRYLAFYPNDRIMDVYRALNPRWAVGDVLELETFARSLRERYTFDLNLIWRDDLTLGEVFKYASGGLPRHSDRAD